MIAEPRPLIAIRPSARRVCKAVFDRRHSSSAAGTTAYIRADIRMKMRAPVNFERRGIKSSAPCAQGVDRDVARVGAIFGVRPAQVQCLDMHRPECLNGLAVFVPGRRFSRPFAPLTCPFTHRFQRIQHLQPAVERTLVEPMAAAVFGAVQAASTQGPAMNRLPFASRFVLEELRSHRRFSSVRQNPIWNDNALPNRRVKTRRLLCSKRPVVAHDVSA